PDELQVSAPARQRVLAADPELATTPLDVDFPHHAAVEGLRRLRYPLLDLTPAFADATLSGERLYHRNDSHLAVSGNRLAALPLAAALRPRAWRALVTCAVR